MRQSGASKNPGRVRVVPARKALRRLHALGIRHDQVLGVCINGEVDHRSLRYSRCPRRIRSFLRPVPAAVIGEVCRVGSPGLENPEEPPVVLENRVELTSLGPVNSSVQAERSQVGLDPVGRGRRGACPRHYLGRDRHLAAALRRRTIPSGGASPRPRPARGRIGCGADRRGGPGAGRRDGRTGSCGRHDARGCGRPLMSALAASMPPGSAAETVRRELRQ